MGKGKRRAAHYNPNLPKMEDMVQLSRVGGDLTKQIRETLAEHPWCMRPGWTIESLYNDARKQLKKYKNITIPLGAFNLYRPTKHDIFPMAFLPNNEFVCKFLYDFIKNVPIGTSFRVSLTSEREDNVNSHLFIEPDPDHDLLRDMIQKTLDEKWEELNNDG